MLLTGVSASPEGEGEVDGEGGILVFGVVAPCLFRRVDESGELRGPRLPYSGVNEYMVLAL